LRYGSPPFNRQTRRRLYAVSAVFSLILWLFLAVAETYTPLHAWLHGGAIPENDDCAIVLLTHGSVHATTDDASLTTPVTWIASTPQFALHAFSPVISHLPAGRAPPVLPAVS